MKTIAVAGTGYVGLSTGTCFADMGNKVTCIDINEEKIAMLQRGEVPIYEPGLSELITRNVKAGRLNFTTSYEEALEDAEFIFICVGTPSGVDGEADLQYVRMAAESVAKVMKSPLIIINKSTVPVGTGDWVADIVNRSRTEPVEFAVVSCPEFTREGSAIYDFMNPDRVVVGSHNQEAAEKVAQLHLPLRTRIVMTDLRTAEMIKYASNAFLATKISFINEISQLCEQTGADVHEVARGMGLDGRIGRKFLHAGPGYGGSCFPKDTVALIRMAQEHGVSSRIVESVVEVNASQKARMVSKIREALGGSVADKTIAVLGLTFKPETDDMREAPSLAILPALLDRGAVIRAHDPEGMEEAKKELPAAVIYAAGIDEAVQNADAVVLLTEWNQYRGLDLPRLRAQMRGNVFVDLRNVYERELMATHGFAYTCVGR